MTSAATSTHFSAHTVGWLISPNVESFAYIEIIGTTATTLTVKGDARGLADNGGRYWVFAPPHVNPANGAMRGEYDADLFIPQCDTRYLWALYRYMPPMAGFEVDLDGAGPVPPAIYGRQTGTNQSGTNQSGHHHAQNRVYDPATGRWTTPDPAATPWSNLWDYVDCHPTQASDPTGLRRYRPYLPHLQRWRNFGEWQREKQRRQQNRDRANRERQEREHRERQERESRERERERESRERRMNREAERDTPDPLEVPERPNPLQRPTSPNPGVDSAQGGAKRPAPSNEECVYFLYHSCTDSAIDYQRMGGILEHRLSRSSTMSPQEAADSMRLHPTNKADCITRIECADCSKFVVSIAQRGQWKRSDDGHWSFESVKCGPMVIGAIGNSYVGRGGGHSVTSVSFSQFQNVSGPNCKEVETYRNPN